MTKVLLYSITPQHMLNILNGNKTIEVRKRDLPQWALDIIASGGVVEGYGYCTKGKPYITMQSKNQYTLRDDNGYTNVINGKVVVKFEVSGSDRYFTDIHGSYHHMFHHIGTQACLSQSQITQYGNGADLYAHHFTNIQPIEPMELSNFYKQVPFFEIRDKEKYLFEFGKYAVLDKEKIDEERKLTKAPQSFMTAWVKNNEKGEKT